MKTGKQTIKPRQIMLSKRANVFYLEYVRIMQKDNRIIYLSQTGDEVERFFNVPERNTAFLLLGKGTSITDAAMRRMAESNVAVGFTGNGGSPMFGMADVVFMTPQSEYRPTEYMQAWAKIWFDDGQRLDVAKLFMRERIQFTSASWKKNSDLRGQNILIPDEVCSLFIEKSNKATDTGSLMAVEAEWARKLYSLLASGFKMSGFTRDEGKRSFSGVIDTANSYLDHGNYLAYGYASVALIALGISFAFPVMHGKTRRGALVFDVADLFKDAIVMPNAFFAAKDGLKNQDFRNMLVDKMCKAEVMDFCIDTIKKSVGIND